VDADVALIAVVGEGMRGTPGPASRIFTAISRHDINIIAIAQGSSELTIAIVVRRRGPGAGGAGDSWRVLSGTPRQWNRARPR
jgi:ACT domain